MEKKAGCKVVGEWRNVPILYDGTWYYIPDGFGDFMFFKCEDDAIAYIEGGEA